MIHRYSYHRKKTMNFRIIEILQNNPGIWMTSEEIVHIMKFGQTRGTGRRIQYMLPDIPQIECRIEKDTRKRYYRYNPEVKQE